MIPQSYSRKILTVGTDVNGKGGIAILLKSYSAIFEQFNYVCSHRFTNRLSQFALACGALFRVVCYCLFRPVKIVHIHTASYVSFYRESAYLLVAKLFGRKVVLHLHGGEFEAFYVKHRRYCNFVCRKADAVVGVSNYFGRMYKRLNLNKNIVVLYNVAEKPLLEKQPHSGSMMNILFMGTIDNNKGIFEVLEMWTQNREFFSDKFNLKICGVGDSERLIELIHNDGLSANVEYLGWVDTQRKNELLSATDIYIQPSHFESLGIAIIEALSYGIPVIASRTGGIPELVDEGKNGYLIEVGNMSQMRERLLLFYNSPHLLQSYSDNAKRKAMNFYSENIERDIIKLYKSLL